jgi:hypothetical protein
VAAAAAKTVILRITFLPLPQAQMLVVHEQHDQLRSVNIWFAGPVRGVPLRFADVAFEDSFAESAILLARAPEIARDQLYQNSAIKIRPATSKVRRVKY